MRVVNMLDAKSSLSRLVQAIETGAEKEIVIARNGKPVARLVPLTEPIKPRRQLGMAKHLPPFDHEAFQALDKEVEERFHAGDISAREISEAAARHACSDLGDHRC